MRWWFQEKEEAPAIEMPVRLVSHGGYVRGKITINPDGTFSGNLGSEEFHAWVQTMANVGIVREIEIAPVILPAKPPWQKR